MHRHFAKSSEVIERGCSPHSVLELHVAFAIAVGGGKSSILEK
jgi:hypothetical protein